MRKMRKEWEIGAGRVTTNFLMMIIDGIYVVKRFREFFPEINTGGFAFIYTKENLYASIINKRIINNCVEFIYANLESFFIRKLMPTFEKETSLLWKELKDLKKEIDIISKRLENEKESVRKVLVTLHNKYLELFGNYAIYTPIVRFSEAALKRLLKKKDIGEEKIISLINPSYKGAQFYLNEELKNITKQISRNEFNNLKKAILGGRLSKDHLVYNRLLNIKEKYGWVKSYINFYKSFEIVDLLNLLEDMYKKGIQNKEGVNKKRRQEINLLDEETSRIIEWLNFIIDMKNRIQNVQAYIFYLGNKLYSLISGVTGIPLEKIEWLTPEEIVSFLENSYKWEDKLMDIIIKNRKRGVLLEPRIGIIVSDSSTIEEIFGHHNIDIEKVFYEDKRYNIQGIFINKKEIKGKAFIAVSHIDLNKKIIEKDHILITRAVTPEYTSYLHKFKAIITDEGGLASHGAIVARELGISTLIGTKNATKVFKHGDEILITEDGTVKKI